MRAHHVWVLFSVVTLGAAALAPAALAGPRADTGAGRQPLHEQVLVALDGQEYDLLGWSTSYSRGVTVGGAQNATVGGNLAQGSVTVFTHLGEEDRQTTLTAGDGAADDKLGWSVAVSGGTVVAGAPSKQIGTCSMQGAAYVFVSRKNGWTQQARLTATDGASLDAFGFSVAIDGDTLAVGAPERNGVAASQGAVYVFTRSGATWVQRAVLTADDGATADMLGVSVALEGGTIVAGARNDDGQTGAAYVFTGSGADWNQQAKLTASDGAEGDAFGTACALDGDTAVVSAPGAQKRTGAAYVFARTGSSWSQEARLVASDGSPGDQFGLSVGVSGDLAVAGAPLHVAEGPDAVAFGAAYPFTRSGEAWTQAETLTSPSAALFGWSVALQDNTVATGAPFSWVGDVGLRGSVHLFTPTIGPSAQIDRPAGRWQRRPATLRFTAFASQGGAAVAGTQYWVEGLSHAWTDAGSLKVAAQGTTRVRVRAVDVNGTPGPVRSCTVLIDSRRPRVAAKPAGAPAGNTARLRYRVVDPRPGCGRALVRLVVADASGRVLTRSSTRPATANAWHTLRISTRALSPGTYRVALRAVDAAGNFQRWLTVTTLTVR